ncbi:hypothetical protein [Sphaerochaeta pleomorpha]|uniref:hypothetical protein n=1 Tax=Sphaerochaeta pleomorpha TaxID=1131707 RepID=UPI0012DF4CF8|nr:hypothetical protein [Sphaerochaeta pleomorpha]
MSVVSGIGFYEVREQQVANIRTVLRFEDFPAMTQESYEREAGTPPLLILLSVTTILI